MHRNLINFFFFWGNRWGWTILSFLGLPQRGIAGNGQYQNYQLSIFPTFQVPSVAQPYVGGIPLPALSLTELDQGMITWLDGSKWVVISGRMWGSGKSLEMAHLQVEGGWMPPDFFSIFFSFKLFQHPWLCVQKLTILLPIYLPWSKHPGTPKACLIHVGVSPVSSKGNINIYLTASN